MNMSGLDWGIMFGFFAVAMAIGIAVSKSAGKSETDFFLGGRSMPWWLLGFSMVATTFSTDTPNLVTGLVRQHGVAGNWCWWAFLLTGMLTVFVYARLWRRSGVLTDVEFYEIRYSGKSAAFLRGFRAIYLGLLFNVVVMAGVSLAAIKIGGVMLGLEPIHCILWASIVTVIFSSLGGFKGVLLTDFLLFVMAMVGAFAAAYFALGHESVQVVKDGETLTGLQAMITHFQDNPDLASKLDLLPALSNKTLFVSLFIIPLAVQWWAAYYPGAEPGGGGYLVQRMLAAKDEKHALGATLFFNIAHYALRPWPWIIVALCSMVVYPFDSKTDRAAARDTVAIVEEIGAKAQSDQAGVAALITAKTAAFEASLNKAAAEQDKGALTAEEISVTVAAFKADLELIVTKVGEAETPAAAAVAITEIKQAMKFKRDGLTALRAGFDKESVPDDKVDHDIGYSAMLAFLPAGWLGLLLTSLVAAYMSTISTHLNWGSSYIVNDVYLRFVKPDAKQSELVWVGRISTVVLMVFTGILALNLTSAGQLFSIVLAMGAGTGLLFVLRWFWWRINAASEISAMLSSFALSLFFNMALPKMEGLSATVASIAESMSLDTGSFNFIAIVFGSTLCWVAVTFMTKPTDDETLFSFCNLINPAGPGWKNVFAKAKANGTPIEANHSKENIGLGVACMLIGSLLVYATLFATGYWLYGQTQNAIIATVIALLCAGGLVATWGKVTADRTEG
ncbi:hypothetical protein BVY04_02790 [bacterium M21]|nr:hypothetical protein BVY04_02790 [bacterium M21]